MKPEAMLHYAMQMKLAERNRPREEAAAQFDLQKKTLDIESSYLDIAKKRRELMEPTAAQREQQTQQLEMFKFTINKYSDMIRDEKLSGTSREIYREMLRQYVSGFPKELQTAAGPALTYSPIDPVNEGLERFERLYPKPRPPQTMEKTGPNAWSGGEAPRDEKNEFAWAQHDIALAEWDVRHKIMKDQLAGISVSKDDYKVPTLFPGATPDRFWFKDRFTGQIGPIDMKYIPQGELQTAIEKFGWSLPDFMKTGMYPIMEPKIETLGDQKVRVAMMRSVTDGGIVVDRVPIGATSAEGGGKDLDNDLKHALSLYNMGGDEDLAKNPTQAFFFQQLSDVADKIGTEEGKAAFDKLNTLTTSTFGYMVAPYDPQIERTFRSYIPLLGRVMKNYYMKDGTFMAIGPVRNSPVPFINEKGETALLYYSDAMKMAIDAAGEPVAETYGIDVPEAVTEPIIVPELKVDRGVPITRREGEKETLVEALKGIGEGVTAGAEEPIRFFNEVVVPFLKEGKGLPTQEEVDDWKWIIMLNKLPGKLKNLGPEFVNWTDSLVEGLERKLYDKDLLPYMLKDLEIRLELAAEDKEDQERKTYKAIAKDVKEIDAAIAKYQEKLRKQGKKK